MKKLLTILLVMLVLSTQAFAGIGGVPNIPAVVQEVSKSLIFTWEQPNLPTDMGGWELYKGLISGGPYTMFADIVYVSPETEYSTTELFTVPDNAETTYYFVILSKDIDGNKSDYSSEVFWKFDYLAPGIPITFTVKVVAD